MASIINATTSSGVAVSGDTSGVLQLATNGGTTAVTIDTSQNVGIGTTSPAYRLDVSGQARVSSGSLASAAILTSTSTGGTAINIQNSGTVNCLLGGYNSITGSGNATDIMLSANQGALAFGTNGVTERMRISSAGNVGIGTTSPQSQFHISRSSPGAYNAAIIENASATGYAQLLYYINGGTNGIATVAYAPGIFFTLGPSSNDTTTPIVFQNNNATERMRIDTSGNVLVGTTTSGVANGGFQVQIAGNGAGKPAVASSGATAAAGDVTWMVYSTTAAQYQFYVNYAGTVFARSTSITGLSDASEKENIKDLETGIDTVMALKPRRFDWKNGSVKNVAGFIAQEVETVLPDLVEEYKIDDENLKKGLKMGDMIPTLVKAIQEQQALITTLQTQVAELKQKVGA